MIVKAEYIYIEEVDSTINYAKQYLQDKKYLLDHNIVIVAESQTNGVGKLQSKWYSPKGNLYLTAVFKPFEDYSWNHYSNINIFNLLVTLSLLHSIVYVLKNSKYNIFCKWPNDIIINEAKVSGILLENISQNGMELLMVSVGTNLNITPKVDEYKVVSLKEINNQTINPKIFSKILVNKIYDNINTLSKDKIINSWLQYAYKINETIHLKMGNIIKKGIFRGINSKGLLLLENHNNVIETLSVGEIY